MDIIAKRLGCTATTVVLAGLMLIGSLGSAEVLPSGLVRETRQVQGSITGNLVDYTVIYPQNSAKLPVFLHQYGQESLNTGTEDVNERVAGYGAFSVFVSLADSHCGYELQDYKDAIDDAFEHYADKVNTGNVTIAGVSYGGAVVYGMAERFPYLFDAVIPIFGVADFGYDETQSWYPMVLQNSPTWGVNGNLDNKIGDRDTYRETRYLVRNAVFGAKNNKYAHYEILHDVDDGVNKTGVQVELSRRYVAELQQLGYDNFRYTETPKAGFVYPQGDPHFPSNLWGQQICYTHGFWDPGNMSLYEFELNTLKPNMLSGVWKRPDFEKTGEFFVPSFLEVPHFRFDLGNVQNNCDEAADISYDVSSPDKYTFQITPRTLLTKGALQLMQLTPNTSYSVTCRIVGEIGPLSANSICTTDATGNISFDFPGVAKGSTMTLKCAVAGSETLLLDDFQSDVAGATPSADDLDPVIGAGDIGTSWKFTTAEPAANDFQVLNNQDVTDLRAGNNNYLKLSNAGGPSANVWAELSNAAKTTDKALVRTDFDLYLPEDAGGGNFVLNGFETTGYGNRAFNVYISPADGAVNYYNGSDFVSTGLNIGLDQWVHVTMSADMSAKKFDITVSGAGTFSGADMPATSGTVGALNMNAKLCYIDNLQVTIPEPIPGDADGNGTVDAADASILADNWLLQSGADWGDGDFNGDGAVNDIDATLMAANWSVDGAASVPELGTISLLLSALGSVFFLFCRCRNYYLFARTTLLTVGFGIAVVVAVFAGNVLASHQMAQDVVQEVMSIKPGPGNPRNSEGDFIKLKDGRILFVYTHFTGDSGIDHAPAHLAGRFSSDGGKTWTREDTLVLSNDAKMNLMSVSLLRLQDDRIALFYLRKNSFWDCRMMMRTSDDEAKTWSEPTLCIPDDVNYYAVNNDRVIQLKSGRLLFPVAKHQHDEKGRPDLRGVISCYFSDDRGKTWKKSKSTLITQKDDGGRVVTQEPGVVELANGRIMLFARTTALYQYIGYSDDGGDTFTDLKPSAIRSPCSPATIERIPGSDKLLLVWNNHENFDADPKQAYGQRTPLTVAISNDNGQTWQNVKNMADDPKTNYMYTSMHFEGDHVLLAYWSRGGICITRVPMKWIME